MNHGLSVDLRTSGTKISKKEAKAKNNKQNQNVTLRLDQHRIPLPEFCANLETDIEKGLTEEQVKENIARYGKNKLRPKPQTHPLARYFVHNIQGLAGVAWVGICVAAVTYLVEAFANVSRDADIENIYIGLSIGTYIVINSSVSYFIEWRAMHLLKSMKDIIVHHVIVIREGKRSVVDARDITVGDLVMLKAGDRIPADIRVTASANFKVDNSNLTKERIPAQITPECTNDNPLMTSNLIFMSTFALEGTCQGIVFNVGERTVVGHIKRHTSTVLEVQSLLSKSMIRIILVYSLVGMCFSLAFCILYMKENITWLQTTLIFVAVYVACVPQQLLDAALVNLTLAGKRMEKHNCLPKHFHTIETLGSIAYILTDKTGVITENKFFMSHLWLGHVIISIKGEEFSDLENRGTYNDLLRCMTLCGKSNRPAAPIEQTDVFSKTQAVEFGLSNFAKEHADEKEFNDWTEAEEIHALLYTATHKYFRGIFKLKDQTRQLVVLMGNPMTVLKHCEYISIDNHPITDQIRMKFTRAVHKMGNFGEIVFGFADMFLDQDFHENTHVHRRTFRFLGLISMTNPIRPTSPSAIAKCQSAGIRVIMLTGDHPATARAVSFDVGLLTEKSSPIITGHTLHDMPSEDLDELIRENEEIVFANISPHHKLLIVQSCQRLGGKVAVTGDDVRDSQAMKVADIGISTSFGSDIVKQASDLILLDNSFASIVDGIENGRLVYDNIEKGLRYALTSVVPQVTPFLLFMFIKLPRPLGAFSVLIISFLTDFFPCLALQYEKPEEDLMRQSPKALPDDELLNARVLRRSMGQVGVIETLAGLFAYFVVLTDNGFHPSMMIYLSHAWDDEGNNQLEDSYGQEWTHFQRKELEYTCHSAYCFAVIVTQIANVIACKARRVSTYRQGMRNWYLNLAILVAFLVGISFVTLEHGHIEDAIRQSKLNVWYYFFLGVPFAIFIFLLEELRSFMIRKFKTGIALDL